ncbi:MAG: flagellar export protein FliJ [Planctomycetes bacterium]|nr:flagellar export protein FliJ [Planctomycetota bacterium]
MKKFRFSLGKVLEYRRQMETQRLRAFSKAVEVFGRRREDLEALGAEFVSYRNRLAEMGVGRISAREMALYRSYLSLCEVKVNKAAEWLKDAARDMEERREDFLAASKDKRILERLEEIQVGHYNYELAREETKELDEVGAREFFIKRVAVSTGVAAGSK